MVVKLIAIHAIFVSCIGRFNYHLWRKFMMCWNVKVLADPVSRLDSWELIKEEMASSNVIQRWPFKRHLIARRRELGWLILSKKHASKISLKGFQRTKKQTKILLNPLNLPKSPNSFKKGLLLHTSPASNQAREMYNNLWKDSEYVKHKQMFNLWKGQRVARHQA